MVLTSCMKYKLLLRKSPDELHAHKVQLGRCMKYIVEFQRLRIHMRNLYNTDCPEDRMERKINSLFEVSEAHKEAIVTLAQRFATHLSKSRISS